MTTINQLIKCPFCNETLKVNSIEKFTDCEKFQASWYCEPCDADISRCFDYDKKTFTDLEKLIDPVVEFCLVEDE